MNCERSRMSIAPQLPVSVREEDVSALVNRSSQAAPTPTSKASSKGIPYRLVRVGDATCNYLASVANYFKLRNFATNDLTVTII